MEIPQNSRVVSGDEEKMYTFKTPRPQKFSLPSNIVYYLTKFCHRAQVYQKLQKTCKYFCSKIPVIICDILEQVRCSERSARGDPWKDDLWVMNLNGSELRFKEMNFNKIWITQKLKVWAKTLPLFSLTPKIYRFEAKKLTVFNQELSFDEFKPFTSTTVEDLHLCEVTVTKSDGKTMVMEELFKLFPNISSFDWSVLVLW